MKQPFPLILAATALAALLGLPALAAIDLGLARHGAGPLAGGVAAGDADLIRVGSDHDDDEDDDDHDRRGHRRGHNDHDDDCDDDDDDDDDCAGAAGRRGNPAPAGSVAPPANGLFGNGAPPRAVTN